MDSHKRILGVLYLVSGLMQIAALVALSLVFSFIFPWIFDQAEMDEQWVLLWVLPFIRILAICIILFISVPSLIGGWGMLTNKSWALFLVLVLGCLKLFSFPFGTAVGIYTIWVYAEVHKQDKPSASA